MTFFQKGLCVSAGQISSIVLGLISTMILARALGKAGMGKYDLVRQVGILAITFFSLGIGNASIYLLNKDREDRPEVINLVVRLLLVLMPLLFLGITGLFLAFPRYFGDLPVLIAVIFGIGVSALLAINALRGLYVAWLNVKHILIADILPSIIMVAGALVLWVLKELDTGWALSIYATGNLLSLLTLLYGIKRSISTKTTVSLRLIKRALSIGWKLLASNVFQVLTPALAVLVFRYKTMDAQGFGIVGLYTRASALCGLAMLLPSTFGPLLYSKWSSLVGDEQNRNFEFVVRMSIAYGATIAALLLVFGRYALLVVYGKEYIQAQQAIYSLIPSILLFGAVSAFINYFASIGKPGVTAVLLAISSAVTIVLTSILVPKIGLLGPGTALSISQLFIIIVFVVLARKSRRINISSALILKRDDLSLLFSQMKKSLISGSSYTDSNRN